MIDHQSKSTVYRGVRYLAFPRVIVALLIMLQSVNTYSDSLPHNKHDFVLEANRIREAATGDINEVFFINAFSGQVPLPNRYYLVSETGSEVFDLTFQSPVGLLWKFKEDAANLPDVSGTIVMRDYDEEARELARKGTGNLLVKKRFTEAGLNIVELEPSPRLKAQFPNWAQLKMVAIHDGKQMLTVSDENSLLWKAMLDVYEALKVKD